MVFFACVHLSGFCHPGLHRLSHVSRLNQVSCFPVIFPRIESGVMRLLHSLLLYGRYYGSVLVNLVTVLVCNVFVCFSVPRLRLFLCVISFRHYKHIIMLLNLSSHRLHRHKYIVFTFPSLAVCQFLLCGFKLFKTACETFRPNILTV